MAGPGRRHPGLVVKRGDLVSIVLPGAYGKPRPALVVQADLFQDHPSVTVLPVTGELRDAPLFRLTVQPGPENGLLKPSQIMVDKPQAVPRDMVGQVFGRMDDATMLAVNRVMMVFLGLA